MRKTFKFVGYVVLVVLVGLGAFAGYVEVSGMPSYAPGHVNLSVNVTAEKVSRGRKYASMLCASCHLDPSTGRFTGKKMADLPAVFGEAYSRNITRDPRFGIGAWTDGELAYLLRTGVTRTGHFVVAMPKFPDMSDDDLESIIAFLHSEDPLVAPAAINPPGVSKPTFFTKLLAHLVMKPVPYPKAPIVAPVATDRVAYGRYLVANLGCFACHSANFRSNNEIQPEKSVGYMAGGNPLQDESGQIVPSANLTFDASGLAHWSEAEFTRAVRTGIRPDNTVLRYPMPPMPELTDEDTGAIYAYLVTVPKIHNVVARAARPAVGAGANEGKSLYYHYGCNSCHGDNGQGIADLRRATEDFPTDARLEAFIRHAPAFRPGTKMPAWNGVIRNDEYAPLISYVRELGRPAGSLK